MRCAVYNCDNNNKKKAKKWRYFKFPKEKALLNKWVDFCRRKDEVNFDTSHICSAHFKPEDFERNLQFEMGFCSRNLIKLKTDAFPTLEQSFDADRCSRRKIIEGRTIKKCITLESNSIYLPSIVQDDQIITSEEIITNPIECRDEILPLDVQSKSSSNTVSKSTPTNTQWNGCRQEYLQYGCSAEVQSPQAIEFIDVKTVQAVPMTNKCSKNFQKRQRICGYIKVSADNKTYTMLCQQCDQDFVIWDWVKFVKHVKEAHSNLQLAFVNATNSATAPLMEKHGGVFIITDEARQPSNPPLTLPLQIDVQRNDVAEKTELPIAGLEPTFSPLVVRNSVKLGAETNNDLQPEQHIIIENCQISVKARTETENISRNEVVRNEKPCNSDSDSSSDCELANEQEYEGVIYLKKTEPEIVLSFLALLHEHPLVLALPNSHGYDAALSAATEQFNQKWPRSMTVEAMKRSVKLARQWYQLAKLRVEKDEKTTTATNDNFQLYFDTCKALWPPRDRKKFCEQCQKEFSIPSLYRRHMVHHEEPKFKCQLCPRSYYFSSMMENHMKWHNNQRDYVCEVCGKSFIQQQHLMGHKRTHIHDRRLHYVCDLCGNTFSWRQTLRKHKIEIHGFPKVKVQPSSSRGNEQMDNTAAGTDNQKGVERRSSQRSKHERGNRKRYLCNFCGNTFAWRQGLCRHKALFHRPKAKVCDNEDAEGSEHTEGKFLSEDIRIAKTEKSRHLCKICGKTFAYLAGLHKHKVQIHGVKVKVRPKKLKKPQLTSSGNMDYHSIIVLNEGTFAEEGILPMDMFEKIP